MRRKAAAGEPVAEARPVAASGARLLRTRAMTRRSDGTGAGAGVPLALMAAGMMLSGGGAAWSSIHDPLAGFGVALAGGVVCAAGAWRLIARRGG